jgi:hypothetical protein
MSKQPRSAGNQVPFWEEIKEEVGKARPVPWAEVGRDQILGRYWELANLDPKETKGNITGQIKALDSICEQLPLVPVEKHKRVRTLDVYQSGWMNRSRGESQSEKT